MQSGTGSIPLPYTHILPPSLQKKLYPEAAIFLCWQIFSDMKALRPPVSTSHVPVKNKKLLLDEMVSWQDPCDPPKVSGSTGLNPHAAESSKPSFQHATPARSFCRITFIFFQRPPLPSRGTELHHLSAPRHNTGQYLPRQVSST